MRGLCECISKLATAACFGLTNAQPDAIHLGAVCLVMKRAHSLSWSSCADSCPRWYAFASTACRLVQ